MKNENEGAFNLRYHHENYLGTPSDSAPVPVFVDKIPPNGSAAPDKLMFAFTGPIVDATLVETDLEAVVPAWTGVADGDMAAFTVVADKLPAAALRMTLPRLQDKSYRYVRKVLHLDRRCLDILRLLCRWARR